MKNFILLSAIAFTLSCSHIPPTVVDTTQTIAVDCLAPAVRDVATSLLDDVASALLTGGDWKAAVNNIATRIKTNGMEAVWCAVNYIKAEATTKLFASKRMDDATVARQQLMYDRASAWLADHK